jgi:hypothetical protein
MTLQANNPTRTDNCIVDGAGRQIKPITGGKRERFSPLGQTKGYRAGDDSNDLVISVNMGRIAIVRAI